MIPPFSVHPHRLHPSFHTRQAEGPQSVEKALEGSGEEEAMIATRRGRSIVGR
jgi:hypothetical protein